MRGGSPAAVTGAPILPNAVYDREQAAELLGIGDTKLRELVESGQLSRLPYTSTWRFYGAQLMRFLEEASR